MLMPSCSASEIWRVAVSMARSIVAGGKWRMADGWRSAIGYLHARSLPPKRRAAEIVQQVFVARAVRLDAEAALRVAPRDPAQGQVQALRRQHFQNPLRPFDDHHAPALEQIVEAEGERVRAGVQAIATQMPQAQAVRATILVDEDERRAG